MNDIDWTKSNLENARITGRSVSAIRVQRIAEGVPPHPRGGRRNGAGGKFKYDQSQKMTSLTIKDIPAETKKAWDDARGDLSWHDWAIAALNRSLP